ncbi:YbfB/YjiJ family MFS transporter [Hyphomicrobium sp.]|uniref:YbfB/YjiJ family MFS transporter n=1 Tax=Hyphomicrobium sp. TaxID=82 RepID=UPI002FDFB2B5
MRGHERSTAIAAALVLVIGMGFGRFAFTGLYPLMVNGGQITVEGGSYAASANYAGYLIGALFAGALSGISSRKLCTFSMAATVVTLGLLALAIPEWLVVTVRGFAGAASAIAMVAASHWLIHDRHHHQGAPALFAGVGVGILVSAEIIAAGSWASLSSHALWLLLALVALAIGLATLILQARGDSYKPEREPSSHDKAAVRTPPFGPVRLIVIYGLAGFGYIITATYLPLLVRSALATIDPIHIWAVFGSGAIPSCFLWHSLHERWGTSRSLMANLGIQAIGVILPVMHSPLAYIGSALIVGGTFMGTVTIAMPAARRVAKSQRFNMLAIMTAAYGVGQIIGPLVATKLYGVTQSFDASLVVAGVALAIASALAMPIGKRSKGHANPAGIEHPPNEPQLEKSSR